MHTDEYEISLSRELSICDNTMKRIKKTLGMMERKHNKSTDAFMEELLNGTLSLDHPDYKDDYIAWRNTHDSLKQWERRKQQYKDHSGYKDLKTNSLLRDVNIQNNTIRKSKYQVSSFSTAEDSMPPVFSILSLSCLCYTPFYAPNQPPQTDYQQREYHHTIPSFPLRSKNPQ